MHIALVNQWYPPDYGGVAVHNSAMARAYTALGHRVTVMTARSAADQLAVADEDGVRVYRVDRWVEPCAARRLPLMGKHLRSLRHLAYSRTVCALVDRLAEQDSIDIAEYAEINAEGVFAVLRGTRVPAVVRCHTPHVLLRRTAPPHDYPFDSSLIEQAEAALVRRANAVTAPSADLARQVEREMRLRPGRVRVVPNAIDVQEFSPCANDDDRPIDGPVTILHVGRYTCHKGIFVLAEALAHLAAQDPGWTPSGRVPWRVVFAGSDRPVASGGSSRARLASFFAAQGLTDRVTLRGFVAQNDLVALYHAADLCVVPSILYESFSYTCLQAMACGRPVVATTMGGIPEVVIDGETGLLVPPGDAVALAAVLGRLIGDATLRRRLGRAGRERAVRLYAHRTVAQQNLAVYAAAINRQHGRVTGVFV
jgi:glycosyltransferase involved in cell wall biosynthesis